MDLTQQTAASASEETAVPRAQAAPWALLSRLEPGASLARHKRLALSLLLLVCCAGLPIAYIKGAPRYHTQAVVFIPPRIIENLQSENLQGGEEFKQQSDTQYREYVQRNVRTINRFDIVQSTLKQLGENGKRWWYQPREDDRRAAERLAGSLAITPALDTYQVTVGLDGDQPEGLAEIVNTLVDVYIAVQKSEEIHAVGSRLRTLQQEMDSLGKEMADDQARRTQLAQELGVSTFTENYVNPYGQRLVPEKQALAGEAARKESSGSSFTAKYQDGIRLSQRIEQARKRRETVDESMKFLDLESRGPGFVSVFAEARSAGLTAKGGRTKLALLFCLAGLVIAFLAPVAIDVAGPRLLVPSDVGRALGFDPLGWVPDRKELGEEFTWDLVMRLAHRIDQERQRHGAHIWMFSAVKSGGGTTTLVNSLGRAFVTLGIPALSVEANAYRADGRFASKSAGSGLSALLRGHSTLSGSIEVGDGEMPDRIPIGGLDGTGHLPDIHRLKEVLGEAAQSYALVLVDMPPVLASVDSEYFARRADCVVLVAEARRVTAPELKRAAKVLERIQPKSVACVLNRVHAADGGGFGQDAKRDFETEAAKPAPAWQQPLL